MTVCFSYHIIFVLFTHHLAVDKDYQNFLTLAPKIVFVGKKDDDIS